MATGAVLTPKRIALSELDAVLEQARVEGWRELAIFSPLGAQLRPDGVPKAHTFYLREPLGTRISKLATLTQLTSLDLRDNRIGDEGGARAGHARPADLPRPARQPDRDRGRARVIRHLV